MTNDSPLHHPAGVSAGGGDTAGAGANRVRREEDDELRRLNRTLRAHSRSAQALLRAEDESHYLAEVCLIIVQDCDHPMVWVGYAEEGETKPVQPVAHAGFEAGYLETLRVTWADTERGRGPTGTAVRTGKPCACRDMLTDPAFTPWRAEAIRRGYASSLALPLLDHGHAFGALTIYARQPDPFTDDEVALLSGLADDLAYGITMLRLRAAHARAEEALRLSEERFVKAFHSSPAALSITRLHDGCFVDVNVSFLRAFGYAREEVVGCTSTQLGLYPDPAERAELLRLLGEQGAIRNYEIAFRTKSGGLRTVLLASEQIEVAGEAHVLSTLLDVTEWKRAEDERERLLAEEAAARHEAERQNALRLRFLGMISHELRTPLASIKGFVTTLLADDMTWDEVTQREFLQIMDQEADKLADMIEQLLDLARIESGTLRVEARTVKVQDILDAAQQPLAALARNHVLNLQASPGLPAVKADIQRVGQVLTNLVGNAAKFSPPGTPIRVVVAREGGFVRVSVCDEGPGIAPEDRPHVFEAFRRGTDGPALKTQGTGLGLAICNGLIRAHGGCIWVEEHKGPGTTIVFTLPVAG